MADLDDGRGLGLLMMMLLMMMLMMMMGMMMCLLTMCRASLQVCVCVSMSVSECECGCGILVPFPAGRGGAFMQHRPQCFFIAAILPPPPAHPVPSSGRYQARYISQRPTTEEAGHLQLGRLGYRKHIFHFHSLLLTKETKRYILSTCGGGPGAAAVVVVGGIYVYRSNRESRQDKTRQDNELLRTKKHGKKEKQQGVGGGTDMYFERT